MAETVLKLDMTKPEMDKFIKDEPFFTSLNSFCLGKTNEEAAEIFRQYLKDKEKYDSMVKEGE